MALTNGPNLGLLVNGNAGEGHYTDLMKQWRGLDALVMPVVKGVGTNTPPGSPADGDAYVVGTSPTGAWAAKNNQIARWTSVVNAWEFYVPKEGWKVANGAVSGAPIWSFTDVGWISTIQGASTIYAKGGGTPGAGYQLDACTMGWDSATRRGWIQSGGEANVSDLLIQGSGGVAIFGSGGINLGQTDLKNYQEGTWTPTIYGRTTAGTPTYVARSGKYTRVGNLVLVAFDIQISAKGGMSGAIAVGGLPWAMTSDDAGGGGQINYQSGNSAGISSLLRFNAATAFYLVSNTAGGTTVDITDANIADETRLVGSAMFFI